MARKLAHGGRPDFDDGLAMMTTLDVLGLGALAHQARLAKSGLNAYYVVNRQINYSNVCVNHCAFCAFWRDTGQEGAYTMSLEQAVDLLVREARMNRREAELECRRYAEEPGQAMSYLLGKREVLRLANAWRASRHGSLRAFHDELLSWGSVPPAVIAWGMGLGPRPAAARVSS